MKTIKRIFKNANNPKSKHHIQSALVVVSLVAVLILALVQLSNVKQNSLYVEDLEHRSAKLNEQDELIVNELTITKKNLSTLEEKFEKLYARFEIEQEYITVNIEDLLRKMNYKHIQYDIKLDEVDHSNCDSKFLELYEEIEYLRGLIK